MRNIPHYAGLVVLAALFAYLLYRAAKAGFLENFLKGGAWALVILAWATIAGYLLSQ